MTKEQYEEATSLLSQIKKDEERLDLLKRFRFISKKSNLDSREHTIDLFDGPESNSSRKTFYLECLTTDMVSYLRKQEINLLTARITKNKILLSKL